MSALSSALEGYLILRRSLGFKLERAEKLLGQFVTYCELTGADVVTIELALSWATLPEGASPSWLGRRLSVVRSFARHLALLDDRTEVPPADMLPARTHRATPYLYREAEVARLMGASEKLCSPLRRATLQTVVGLLYVTGMRVGEVIRLDREDVDLTCGLLLVRNSKFGKSRELPVHDSTTVALRAYARQRDELCPLARSPAFFIR